MIHTIVCKGCEERLRDASYAIRRHSAAMSTAIGVAAGDAISEEEFQNYRTDILNSFKGAQEAWDTYCRHLSEHGFAV